MTYRPETGRSNGQLSHDIAEILNPDGDLVLRTRDQERVRLTRDGSVHVQTALPVTSQQNASFTTPAGVRAFEVKPDGTIVFGRSRLAEDSDTSKRIASFMWDPATDRITARSLRLGEVGDPPDLVLARAGDSNYPDGNNYPSRDDFGVQANWNLGTIRWQGYAKSATGGGEGFRVTSACIYARSAEEIREERSFDGQGNEIPDRRYGGELWFRTTPRGSSIGVDRMAIYSDGATEFFGNARLHSVGAATPTGGQDGDLVKGDGCLWVNDRGTWKKTQLT